MLESLLLLLTPGPHPSFSRRTIPATTKRHVTWCVVATLALADCRRRTEGDVPRNDSGRSKSDVHSEIVRYGDSLEFRLVAPESVKKPHPARLRVTTRNVAKRDIQLTFGGDPPILEIEVRDSLVSGIIWRAPTGPVSLGMSVHHLRAGDSLVLEQNWPLESQHGEAVPTGTYLLTANLPILTRNGTRHIQVGRLRMRVRE